MTDIITPPTPDQLDGLAALEAAATPGPWKTALTDDTFILGPNGDVATTCQPVSAYDDEYERMDRDAAFIVALRNAAPALIAAAREREELRARLVAEEQSLVQIRRGSTMLRDDNAAIRAERDELRKKYLCPIGAENGSMACSAGSCPECVSYRLDYEIATLRTERDAAVARAKSAEQDWANREADTMRLTVQCEDAQRAISSTLEQASREASLRIKTEAKLAEVRTERDELRAERDELWADLGYLVQRLA